MSIRVQSITLSKNHFPTRAAAAAWLATRGHSSSVCAETKDAFTFQQFHRLRLRGATRRLAMDTGVIGLAGRMQHVAVKAEALDLNENITKLDAEPWGVSEDNAVDLCRLDMSNVELVLRAGDGTQVTAARRMDMLTALKAGEVVHVGVDVIGFRQAKNKPIPLPGKMRKLANRKFITFADADLPRFAKSFTGKPFLLDHVRAFSAIGGTILSSEARESAKFIDFAFSAKLVKEWAVEAALDGTLQTFSIGFDPPRPGFRGMREAMSCSLCGCAFFSRDCTHSPGEEVKVANGRESVIVEAVFSKPQGAELSAVAFPAVTGTHVEGIKPV